MTDVLVVKPDLHCKTLIEETRNSAKLPEPLLNSLTDLRERYEVVSPKLSTGDPSLKITEHIVAPTLLLLLGLVLGGQLERQIKLQSVGVPLLAFAAGRGLTALRCSVA